MRKLTAFLALLASTLLPVTSVLAQSINPSLPWMYASDYGQWSILSTSPGNYTWPGTIACQVPRPGGGTFFPFKAGSPVFVRDALTPAHSEIVTVSSSVNTSASCGFTGSLAYSHVSFQVLSATGGLQEALNVLASASQPSPMGLILNANWRRLLTGLPGYTTATPGTVISTVTGSANVYLVDNTSVPWTYYRWNGTQYLSDGGSIAPTVTLGAGAGTAPTGLTVVGNGSDGLITFTAGTAPTASATIASFTWPVSTAGGYTHAPVGCAIYEVAPTSYTTATFATAFAASTATGTLTASATALNASTLYMFRYSGCR